MDHSFGNTPNDKGPLAMVVSFISAIFSFISLKDAQVIVSTIAGAVAIASGVMAIRYYYYATKKAKNQ